MANPTVATTATPQRTSVTSSLCAVSRGSWRYGRNDAFQTCEVCGAQVIVLECLGRVDPQLVGETRIVSEPGQGIVDIEHAPSVWFPPGEAEEVGHSIAGSQYSISEVG
jgi:hypothetical protein